MIPKIDFQANICLPIRSQIRYTTDQGEGVKRFQCGKGDMTAERELRVDLAGNIDDLISVVYAYFLKRSPDAAGMATHREMISNGLELHQFVENIANSAEAAAVLAAERKAHLEHFFSKHVLAVAERGQVEIYTKEDLRGLVEDTYALAFGRRAGANEIENWEKQIRSGLSPIEFVRQLRHSHEAAVLSLRPEASGSASIPQIVQGLFDALLDEGAKGPDIERWAEKIRLGDISVLWLLSHLFRRRLDKPSVSASTLEDTVAYRDNAVVGLLGTANVQVAFDGDEEARGSGRAKANIRFVPRSRLRDEPKILVSAIASMYRGKKFLRQFLDNITSQTIFRDYCELIIIDAASPENEYDIIKPYESEFSNIIYHRTADRIGIYAAWNAGIRMSRGEFITNTNLDDLRRADSFERQVRCFDEAIIPDVVYQDFYYSAIEGCPDFELLAEKGIYCELPIVTPHNLMYFNSPHNAPMWRRRLHDEIGWFDTAYRSAGDCDFWLRAVEVGKIFYKINDPHIGYYFNPTGISTNGQTVGVAEHKHILQRLAPKLVPPSLTMPYERFAQEVGEDISYWTRTPRYDLAQQALLKLSRSRTHRAPVDR